MKHWKRERDSSRMILKIKGFKQQRIWANLSGSEHPLTDDLKERGNPVFQLQGTESSQNSETLEVDPGFQERIQPLCDTLILA